MVTTAFLEVINTVPLLSGLPPRLREEMAEVARALRVEENTTAYMRGQKPTSLALIVSGEMRIFTSDSHGKEVTLYHTDGGCFCLVNAISVLSGRPVDATAFAKTDCEVLLFPTERALQWMRDWPEFNELIMGVLADRIVTLLNLVSDLAFRHVDDRLLDFLQERCESTTSDVLCLTHEQIARELGTAREVVSRNLKKLEQDGIVELGRGTIRLKSQLATTTNTPPIPLGPTNNQTNRGLNSKR